ncbi:hypothetical protein ACIGMX_09720 [Streptomyces aquilus]
MEQIGARVVILLLAGVLVVALTLYSPSAGAAIVGATSVVALLAQLMTGE